MKKYGYLITGDDIQTMGLTLIPGKVAPSGKKFLIMKEITSVYYAKVDLPAGSDKRLVTYERVSSSITLTAEPSQLSFNYAGGSKTVIINTNADYSLIRVLSSDPDRFAISLEGNVLTVTVPNNDSENSYNGGIQITVGDKSITVSVSQSGSKYERFLECSVGDRYDFKASGGVVNFVYTLITYKNGEEYSRESVIPTDYDYTPVDGFTVNTGDRSVTASNRGTTIGSERSLYLTAIYQGSNFQVSTQTRFVQEANVIEDVLYGEWVISLTADKYTSSSSPAPASKAQSTITATATRTKTNVYTSGATRGLPNENATPSLSVSGTGFILRGNVVTIADRTNVEGAHRTGVVTATHGGKSKTLNLYQAENKIVGVSATGTVTAGRGTILNIHATGGSITWAPIVEYSSGWSGTPPTGVTITYSLSNTNLGATQKGNVTTWPSRGITIGAWRGVNVNIHASSSYTTTPVLGTVSTGQNINGITSISIRACGGAVDPPQTNYPASRESHCFSFRCFFSSGSDAEISAIDGYETWSFNQSWGSWAPTSENRWWGNLTVSSRGTTIGNARTGTLTCTVKGTINGVSVNVSDSITITQAANLITELRPTAQGFRYNKIGAGDTTATPISITPGANSVVYVFSSGSTSKAMPGSSYGSFTSREEYSLGTVQNGFTAVNSSTGVLTATHRGTVVGPERTSGVVTKKYICTWTHSSTYGGSTVSGTGSTTATCTQALNTIESFILVNASAGSPEQSFTAAGGQALYYPYFTWSSGSAGYSKALSQDVTYDVTGSGFSLGAVSDAASSYGQQVVVASRGTVIGAARSGELVSSLDTTYNSVPISVSCTLTLTQALNKVESCTVLKNEFSYAAIAAAGGTSNPAGAVTVTYNYSSGATGSPQGTTTTISYSMSSTSGFSIDTASGVVTATNNTSTSSRTSGTITRTVKNSYTNPSSVGGNTISVTSTKAATCTQSAGAKTYANPVVSLSYSTIPAKGGTVSPTLGYSQTWGWNGATSGGGTITSGGTIRYSGTSVNVTSGAVSASSKGTNISNVTTVTTVTATVTLNGKSGSKSATVYQALNTITALIIANGAGRSPVTSVPASGDTVEIFPKFTFSSGSEGFNKSASQKGAWSGTATGFTVSTIEASSSYGRRIVAANRGTTIGAARDIVSTFTLNTTINGVSVNKSASHTLTQAANSVTYTAPIMTYTKSVIPASGGTGSVRMTFKSTATYTSGTKQSVSSSPDPNGQDAVHRAWRPTDINPWMAEGYTYGGLSPYNYPNVTQDETTCTLSYVEGSNPFSDVGRIVRMKCTAPPKSGAGNVLYCGGIRYNFSTSEVGNYYWHLIIKLPVGYRAWFSYNSLGTGGNASFCNGGIPVGTGDWQAVYGRYIIGEGGNTLNLYIVVSRDSSTVPAPTASNPVIMDIAYSVVTRGYNGTPNPLYFTNKGVFTYPSLGLQPTVYAQPINNSTTNDTVVKNRDFAPMLYWNVYGFTYYFCMFVPQDRNIITSCKVGGNADNTRYTYAAPSSPVSAGSAWYHIGLWAVMSSGKSGYLDNNYYSSASNQTSWATIGTSGAAYNFFHRLNIASRGLIEGDARSVIITLATLNTMINPTYAKSATYTVQQSANVATYGLPIFKSWIQKGIIPASGGSSQSRGLVYTQPVTYSSGDTKSVTTGATVAQESYWGRIDGPQTNAMPVYDLFFETTSYLISLYNHVQNGVTTLTRVYAYPGGGNTFGSRYEIQVKNTGLGHPGLGGFAINTNHPSGLPSGTSFLLTLMCRIPSGYTINCATNSLGTGGKITWYSSQEGNDAFRSYSLGITLGTGYLPGFLFHMWFNGTAGTPSSPKLLCQLLSVIEVSNQDANLGVGRGGAIYSSVFKLPSLGTLVQPLGAERYNRTVWLTYLLNGVKFGNLLYPVQAANVASVGAWVPQAVFNTPAGLGSYTLDYHDQYILYTKEATRKTTYTSGSITTETATDTDNIKLTSNQSWCVVAALGTSLGFTENNTGADRMVTIGVSYGGVTTTYSLTQLKKDVGNISLQIVNNTREYIALSSEGYAYIGWEGSSPRGDWHFENLECDAYNTITYDGIGNVDFSTASSDYMATVIAFGLNYLRSYRDSGTLLQTFAYKLEFLLSTDGTTNWYTTSLTSGTTNGSVGSTGNLSIWGGAGATIPAHTSPNSIRIVLKITINSAG